MSSIHFAAAMTPSTPEIYKQASPPFAFGSLTTVLPHFVTLSVVEYKSLSTYNHTPLVGSEADSKDNPLYYFRPLACFLKGPSR